MNKFILVALLSVFTLNVVAQDDLAIRATKITNEMTEVLTLTEEDRAKVYQFQLKRFQEVVSFREMYKDDDQTRKQELKKVYKRLFGKLKKTLGKEKMQQWRNYKREIGRE
tara:strand:- start:17 stop:349 length:333 start_codon:yes stop_codon:yes gene_type:complete